MIAFDWIRRNAAHRRSTPLQLVGLALSAAVIVAGALPWVWQRTRLLLVRTPAGHAGQLPVDLLKAVTTRARELGRQVANDDIILLGLLDLEESLTARQILEGEGVESNRVVAALRTRG